MSGSLSHSANAEPNLTPILDMVFQLITFFMLVINFKAASMDLNLKLPVVGSAKMVESGGKDLLVLNIDSAGTLRVYGVPKPNVEDYVKLEAQTSLDKMNHELGTDKPLGTELPTMIVVRADSATPFKMLNRVIKACQDSGFRNFALKALNRAE